MNTPADNLPIGSGPAPLGRVEKSLSVARCLAIVVPGLLPLVGIATCLFFGYSAKGSTSQRSLAKALLTVHAALLGLLIAALCVWIILLFSSHPIV